MKSIQLGDVIAISVPTTDPDTGLAVSWAGYTSVKLALMPPRGGSVILVTPTISLGSLLYTTAAGEVNVSGRWEVQGLGYNGAVIIAHTVRVGFDVEGNLA
jgi:hypothetical protein